MKCTDDNRAKIFSRTRISDLLSSVSALRVLHILPNLCQCFACTRQSHVSVLHILSVSCQCSASQLIHDTSRQRHWWTLPDAV